MMRATQVVGRLVTASFVPPFTIGEFEPFSTSVRAIISSARQPVIIASDARDVRMFPPEISDRFVGLMRADNPRIERHGLIINDSSLFGLQVARILRDAKSNPRRIFHAPEALVAWLAEVATAAEIAEIERVFAPSA